MSTLYILDRRDRWGPPLARACQERGWRPKIITGAHEVEEAGHGFVRIHAHPVMRLQDQLVARDLAAEYGIDLVQDCTQIDLYDDKRGQARAFAEWMPETWIFEDQEQALDFATSRDASYPMISKADVGASSKNVRVLQSKADAVKHIRRLFGAGVPIDHCSSPHIVHSRQRGYVLLQRFIPHEITWRVNIVGRQRAVFKRRNFAHIPVAQTGNTLPAPEMTDEVESLLHYADRLFAAIGTRWCAADILRDGDGWRLLETSLAWPWPSLFNGCDSNPFWPSKRPWRDMWRVLLDELEAGVQFRGTADADAGRPAT